MTKYIFSILIAIAGFAIIGSLGACSGCKEPKAQCEQEGYEPVGDSCACPTGKFESYGVCRALKPNELFGATIGCKCMDGIFFLASAKFTSGNGEKILRIETINEEGIQSSTSLDCIETTLGDSIWGDWPGICYIEGMGYFKKVNGMYYKNGTAELKFRYVRYEPDTDKEIVKDSCIVTLKGN